MNDHLQKSDDLLSHSLVRLSHYASIDSSNSLLAIKDIPKIRKYDIAQFHSKIVYSFFALT